MTIDVVGIGLDGLAGLSQAVRQILEQATVLIGSQRHLGYLPEHSAERIVLANINQTIETIQQRSAEAETRIAILTSGDPLFFGLGRLLLAALPAEQLRFHPHVSAIQLAFNRIKVPWQDAIAISAHGRQPDALIRALQKGCQKIAVLTDACNTPAAIARLLQSLDLPSHYQLWLCENLGGTEERVRCWSAADLPQVTKLTEEAVAPLNVVVLRRLAETAPMPALPSLPRIGIPDRYIASFPDRPGLMTKREVRLQVLGELALQPHQIVWDIGAGTGSVAIEIARLCPESQIYAIEKTAAGLALIRENQARFQTENLIPISGTAPACLRSLPPPHRIFIGGSGGHLSEILAYSDKQLQPDGVLVLALATLERLNEALSWFEARNCGVDRSVDSAMDRATDLRQCQQEAGALEVLLSPAPTSDSANPKRRNPERKTWHYQLLQIQLSRSVPVGSLTRFAPLNPVMLLAATRSPLTRMDN